MIKFPLIYCIIIILILTSGFFGLVNSWIIEDRPELEEPGLEIIMEFKDTVVLDSVKELDIIFSTD